VKFAHALVQANEEQGRVRAKAAAHAVQVPVDNARQQIITRMDALEQSRLPEQPEPELVVEAAPPPQKWEVEVIDRDDLGEEFNEIMCSPLTVPIFNMVSSLPFDFLCLLWEFC
jgi:hypothetical protein